MSSDLAGLGPRYLDEDSFKHFAPLLHVCQDYARHSGCRFIRSAFDGVDSFKDPQDPVTAAKCAAMPAIHEFAERLKSGSPELLEELEKAFRLVMIESARNSMITTCKELEIFPPSPPPVGIDEEDCSYEDVSAKLEVIAQRLYNDQARRCCSADLGNQLLRRALTASFIVDFGSEVPVPLPPMPETLHLMLQEFATRATEWAAPQGQTAQEKAINAFLTSLHNFGTAEQEARARVQTWWTDNKRKLLWGAAGAGAMVITAPVTLPIAIGVTAAAIPVAGVFAIGAGAVAVARRARQHWTGN